MGGHLPVTVAQAASRAWLQAKFKVGFEPESRASRVVDLTTELS